MAPAVVGAGVHHHVGDEGQADDRQDRRDPVAAVEHVHGVLVLATADEEDGHDRGQQAEAADDEREEDPRLWVGPAGDRGDGEHANAQDHRADVLGSGRLEQVRAAAGAVADVVTDEVGDDARVARVILGDARLDLAHEVRADVGGLGVDAAAELGEEGDEGGAEAEADDQEGRLGDGHVADEGAVGGEDAPHAEQGQGDDEEAGNGAAAHGHLDGLDEAAPRSGRGAHVRLDADVHADDARRHRAGGADEERDGGHDRDRRTRKRGHVGDVRRLDQVDDDADDYRATKSQEPQSWCTGAE